MNVLSGERYGNITKEVKEYLKGAYGRAPAEINQELYKKANGDEEPITCRPADLIEPELEEAKEKMEKSIDAFSNELVNIRTGRANPSMLDRVMVEYYGSPTPLNQVAGISVVEGRQLVIKPYDKNSMKDIEHGIYQADLGLTPQNDGTVIRIVIPPLTEERRKEMVNICFFGRLN